MKIILSPAKKMQVNTEEACQGMLRYSFGEQ